MALKLTAKFLIAAVALCGWIRPGLVWATSDVAISSPPMRVNLPLHPRYALTRLQIAEALAREFADSGVEISAGQISLLAEVAATEPDPVLDIKSVERITDQPTQSVVRSKVKLACRLPSACLPFYAIVTWPAGKDGHTKSEFMTAHTGKAHHEITMQAGAHATLMLDDNRAHIRLAVISLENGKAGDRIRVESTDRKQRYTAEVVTRNQLKGSY